MSKQNRPRWTKCPNRTVPFGQKGEKMRHFRKNRAFWNILIIVIIISKASISYCSNVDENTITPGQYGIKAIPTLILFKNGEVVEQLTGAVSKTSIITMLKEKALS